MKILPDLDVVVEVDSPEWAGRLAGGDHASLCAGHDLQVATCTITPA